jgi:YHS domain-containing protein
MVLGSEENLPMASSDTLTNRLDAEFAATHERIRGMQAESIRISEESHTRFKTFTRLRERVNELTAPRLQQLRDRFPEADSTSVPSPHGDSVSLRLDSDLVRITVAFSLSHDGALGNALLDYNLDILPVFIRFDGHFRLEIPLGPIEYDFDKIAHWLDDRIVGFVHTYMAIQFVTQYQGDNMVIDPVAHLSFPKAFAQSGIEFEGKTYHFLSEQTRREFECDPAPYTSE